MLAGKGFEQSAKFVEVCYPQGTAPLYNDRLFLKPAKFSCDSFAMGADATGNFGVSWRW
jgi:hypothetical protein